MAIQWRKIIGAVWTGHTVPEAFSMQGYSDKQRRVALNETPDMKVVLRDVAMLASHIDELLRSDA